MQPCGSRLVFPLLLLWFLGTALWAQELKPGEIHASVAVQADSSYAVHDCVRDQLAGQELSSIQLLFVQRLAIPLR